MDSKQTVIQPPARFALNAKEIWQYRELFYFFTWRDIKVKYKQTVFGVAWALIQPLGLMLLFSFVFKQLSVPTGTLRYEIHVLSGIILWNFFNSAVSHASESIIEQSNLIRKVYFPRLVIPCSALLTALFDLCIAMVLFLVFCIIYGELPGWTAVLYFPLAVVQLLFTAFGFSTLLSALNVHYRDFRYVIPFLLQLFFFGSQVIYSLDGVASGNFRWLLALNPLNGVLEIFRTPFGQAMDQQVVLTGALSTIAFIFIGIYYFRKTEAYFADLA